VFGCNADKTTTADKSAFVVNATMLWVLMVAGGGGVGTAIGVDLACAAHAEIARNKAGNLYYIATLASDWLNSCE